MQTIDKETARAIAVDAVKKSDGVKEKAILIAIAKAYAIGYMQGECKAKES